MLRFPVVLVAVNTLTLLAYATICGAQLGGTYGDGTYGDGTYGDGTNDGSGFTERLHNSITAKVVEDAKCVAGDCRLSVSSKGSGEEMDDGCVNTNGTCTGVCERCHGSNPDAQITGFCKKVVDDEDGCVVEETVSGANRGVYTCGSTVKYRCHKSRDGEDPGDGPSGCCTETQDGTQEIPGTGGCATIACNPGQQ